MTVWRVYVVNNNIFTKDDAEGFCFNFLFVNNECMQEKRFHNWLEGARDWAVSRTRFWGTPLPLWMSQDGEEIVVMDSIEKLEKLSGVKVNTSTVQDISNYFDIYSLDLTLS
jgi:isoleucyl-tRNA synthetase